MQAIALVLAFAAVANAGGITGYSTGNYVQHAHTVAAVAAPAIAAAPVVGPAGLAYAAPAVAAVPVAKAIAPAAVSSQFVNRAPAARIAVAAAPIVAPAPVAVAHAAPIAYGAVPALHPFAAPALAHAYAAPALLG